MGFKKVINLEYVEPDSGKCSVTIELNDSANYMEVLYGLICYLNSTLEYEEMSTMLMNLKC